VRTLARLAKSIIKKFITLSYWLFKSKEKKSENC
jgi:hypothetical protein